MLLAVLLPSVVSAALSMPKIENKVFDRLVNRWFADLFILGIDARNVCFPSLLLYDYELVDKCCEHQERKIMVIFKEDYVWVALS